MSNWNCLQCPEVVTSLEAFKLHVLDKHNQYQEKGKAPIDLTIQTLENLRTTKAEVEWLLINKPETRGNDNLLVLEHLKYFQHMFIYTPESQKINFRNPNGITYQEFIYMRCWETVRRCRQKIQETDRKYHEKDGSIKKEHLCLLPSEKTELKRERREKVIHDNIRYI